MWLLLTHWVLDCLLRVVANKHNQLWAWFLFQPEHSLAMYGWFWKHICVQLNTVTKEINAKPFFSPSLCVQCILMPNSLHNFRVHGHSHTAVQLKLNNRIAIKMPVHNSPAPADNLHQQQGMYTGMIDLFICWEDTGICIRQRWLRASLQDSNTDGATVGHRVITEVFWTAARRGLCLKETCPSKKATLQHLVPRNKLRGKPLRY